MSREEDWVRGWYEVRGRASCKVVSYPFTPSTSSSPVLPWQGTAGAKRARARWPGQGSTDRDLVRSARRYSPHVPRRQEARSRRTVRKFASWSQGEARWRDGSRKQRRCALGARWLTPDPNIADHPTTWQLAEISINLDHPSQVPKAAMERPTAPPTASVLDLAPETLALVLEFVEVGDTQFFIGTNLKSLCNASLVCRDWRDVSQRQLAMQDRKSVV